METKELKHDCGSLKINLGCGRLKGKGEIGVDIMPYTDNKGNQIVDIVRDVEKRGLPFCDNSAELIIADNVLEHFDDLEFVLNECHRVLHRGGVLQGVVPNAGSDGSFRDPTHKRFFTKSTFDYFCGQSEIQPDRPIHPKYARYGFLPWEKLEVHRPNNDGSIVFKMRPI